MRRWTSATTRFDMEIRSLTLPDGRPGRTVGIRFKPDFRVDENDDTARDAEHVFGFILARDTLDLTGTLLNALALLLVFMARRSLRDADGGYHSARLRSTGKLAHASPDRRSTLGQRSNWTVPPTELMPIVLRLNDLLQRLQDTLEREKAFSSDVAHELRTPLSGLETALEVSATAAALAGGIRARDRPMSGCLRRMHAMVDNLLMLARAESKQLAVQREPMNLAELCREAWINFQQRADERKLHIEWCAQEDCVVNSDQEKIRLLLHNFFDNAVSYTEKGGQITIVIERRPKARLQVSNTGSKLSSEDATHVFERFWRGDRARTAGNHCGLGLTLCRNIAQVLGGVITAKSDAGVFTVTLELPEPARDLPAAVSKN